ncbi:MAG: hypothetical protein ACRCZP_19730 [Phycicoccus sp.]
MTELITEDETAARSNDDPIDDAVVIDDEAAWPSGVLVWSVTAIGCWSSTATEVTR